ncbi:MAG TPA: hypothetical protein VK550_23505 [Polyangiaceae bacterium]|nr:hypothetical protein [Polyangiaceae bacterium]
MTERSSCTLPSDDKARPPRRLGVLAAVLALSACVSDADPREESRGPGDARAGSDVRDGTGDSLLTDRQDSSVPEDGDIDTELPDAISERAIDVTGRDGSDETRDRDATDVSTDPVIGDATADIGASDGDARTDAVEAGTAEDARDSGGSLDVSDAGAPADVADAANDGDANALGDGGDGGDGGVLFYQEDFDTALGTFSSQTNVCGATPPQWTNNVGYARASDPPTTGVSRIASPAVVVPPNTSNVTLRMSHKFETESGFDASQLLISINSGTATQVTTFTTGGYVNGGQTNPTTCALTNTPGMYVGWSGTQAEMVSTVNLSAAPFNVVAGNTITIMFRMTTDSTMGGVGWDINWVTLSANSP